VTKQEKRKDRKNQQRRAEADDLFTQFFGWTEGWKSQKRVRKGKANNANLSFS